MKNEHIIIIGTFSYSLRHLLCTIIPSIIYQGLGLRDCSDCCTADSKENALERRTV